MLHGAIFLCLRETGELVKRAQRVVPFVWGINLLVIALVVITGVTATNVFKQALLNPGIVPLDYVILFPNVMVSSLSPAWSLTIIPFVMLYQAWIYWVFRKRIEPHAIGHY